MSNSIRALYERSENKENQLPEQATPVTGNLGDPLDPIVQKEIKVIVRQTELTGFEEKPGLPIDENSTVLSAFGSIQTRINDIVSSDGLAGQVDANTRQIKENKDSIIMMNQDVVKNTIWREGGEPILNKVAANITDNNKILETHTAQIERNRENIALNNQYVAENGLKLDIVQKEIINQGQSIQSIQTDVQDMKGTVAGIRSNVTGNTDKIKTIESAINTSNKGFNTITDWVQEIYTNQWWDERLLNDINKARVEVPTEYGGTVVTVTEPFPRQYVYDAKTLSYNRAPWCPVGVLKFFAPGADTTGHLAMAGYLYYIKDFPELAKLFGPAPERPECFRLPNLNGRFLKAVEEKDAGKLQEDAIPDIGFAMPALVPNYFQDFAKGALGSTADDGDKYFHENLYYNVKYETDKTKDSHRYGWIFDPSKVTNVADETRPKNVGYQLFISC